MSTPHTPLPWSADTAGYPIIVNGPAETGPGSIVLMIADPADVAGFPGDDENMANAALVVRAVNAHEALLAALRGWEAIFFREDAYASPLVKTQLIETRAAIRTAKGESNG
jgi:hypothetical protein